MLRTHLLSALTILIPFAAVAGPDPFIENVRPTNAIPAADEAKKFHLPPGFEIQLIATEPDIGKPFNIAFDAKGRLWVTCSHAYPFPAKDGKDPLDRIMILDDFDPVTGRARKITTFADNLNIPIGIYPLPSCDGCIVYSIPNIYLMKDTDGDGKADKTEKLIGPFSYDRDTHGMASNFRRGFDGWIYGCHGFNNITHAVAKDGSSVDLNSGNTYRFKIDGSHIEQFTWGQTNPFGMAFDELGNLYTSDSHSKPFYQLIRGGYYEGIGKQHDGLGFAPMMMHHLHNSTAIASTFYYADDKWPEEFRGNLFCGNVVTSRINRDSVEYKGTTPTAHEQPDFLTTEDPWFRPVNLYLGPDGQMWVADFYNKIIGHYEVPLTHPGRDHDHGRIWRIVYKGEKTRAPEPWKGDLTKANVDDLAETLKSPNLAVRLLATDQLSDRIDTSELVTKIRSLGDNPAGNQFIHLLWADHRKQDNRFFPIWLVASAMRSDDPSMRVHAMRVLAELPDWPLGELPRCDAMAISALQDPDMRVRRAAADAIGRHPVRQGHQIAFNEPVPETQLLFQPLLDVFKSISAEDSHFQYATKVAIRDVLKQPSAFAKLPSLNASDARLIADVAVAVPTEESGKFVAAFIADEKNDAIGSAALVKHAFRYAPAADTAGLIATVRKRFAKDIDTQASVLRSVMEAGQQRGVPLDADLHTWAADLAVKLLTSPAKAAKATVAREQSGTEIAKTLKDPKLAPTLEKLALDRKANPQSRGAAVQALAACDESRLPNLMKVVADAAEPVAFRNACVDVLSVRPPLRDSLIELLKQAPTELQIHLALGLAADKEGGEKLFAAVKSGAISPRALQFIFVPARLRQSNVPDVEARIADLTRGIGSLDEDVQRLLEGRKKGYPKAKASIDNGQKIFEKNCIACHSIDGKGALIGPQLDGIGNRGLERVLEDVLDPNRAVDPAFHAWTLKLKDGSDLSAIIRREEGETLIVADPTGKEIPIPKAQITARKESNLSLMPTNFGEVIPEPEFYDLMAFLLSKNAKKN